MANTWAPFGFRPFGHRDGSAPTQGLERRFMNSSNATAVFTGDPVYNSTAEAGFVVAGSTSGNAIVYGIFQGCEYYNTNVARVVWSSYFPASVGSSNPVTAYVVSDPDMQFLVQASTEAVVGSSQIGWNFGFTSSAAVNGNTLSGVSAVGIRSTSASASSSLPFQLVDLYQNFGPPGVNGTSTTEAGQWLIVTPANWTRRQITGVST